MFAKTGLYQQGVRWHLNYSLFLPLMLCVKLTPLSLSFALFVGSSVIVVLWILSQIWLCCITCPVPACKPVTPAYLWRLVSCDACVRMCVDALPRCYFCKTQTKNWKDLCVCVYVWQYECNLLCEGHSTSHAYRTSANCLLLPGSSLNTVLLKYDSCVTQLKCFSFGKWESFDIMMLIKRTHKWYVYALWRVV